MTIYLDILAERGQGTESLGSVMAGDEVAEPPLPVTGDRIEWDEIHGLPVVSAVSPPPKTPWSMVSIRKNGSNDPPIVFPPIDHENLHVSPDPPTTPNLIPHIHAVSKRILLSDSDSDSDSNSSATFSPSDSSPAPLSPLFLARPKADAAYSWLEVLNSKVNGLMRSFWTMSRGVFSSWRSAAFTAILVAFLYFRRRMRLKSGGETRDRLISIIKEKDEKINELLDQISRMNQLLLSLQKVGTP